MELIVVQRAKDLTKGVFKVGTIIDLDTDDMVVYHKGLQWNVREVEGDRYVLGCGDTILEVVK